MDREIKLKKLYYSTDEFAKITGLSKAYIRNLCKNGLPKIDCGKNYRIKGPDALEYLGFRHVFVEE